MDHWQGLIESFNMLTCHCHVKKKKRVVFYKIPVKILWPKTMNWIGTYINTISQSPCRSLYTPLLQSSLNICSQNVFVFFKQNMKTWNENLATVRLKGCFPSTAWKLGFHSMEIQSYCARLPCQFPISKIRS